MILTHGGNSIIRDDNEFVVLYNGISNRGLPITEGSFGTVSRDTSGPLIAPDGLGMPYFNRRNFESAQIISEHEEFKSVFNSKDWTIDFWLKISGGSNNYNQGPIAFIRNADNNKIFWVGEDYYGDPYVTTYATLGAMKFSYGNWYHLAIVSDSAYGYCSLYQNGIYKTKQAINNNVQNANSLKFNYYSSAQSSTNLQCYIAQFAIRAYPVWTANFTPPTQMY